MTSLEEQLEAQLLLAKGEKRKAEIARQKAVEDTYLAFKSVAHEMLSQAQQRLANARRLEALASINYRKSQEKLEQALQYGPSPTAVIQNPVNGPREQPDETAKSENPGPHHDPIAQNQIEHLAISCRTFMNEPISWGETPSELPGYLYPRPEHDPSGPNNTPVLAVNILGIPKAYPFQVIAEKGVINDVVAMNDILVVIDPVLSAGAVYYRKLDNLTLNFHVMAHREDGLMVIRDRETGSVWQALTGRAIDGPLIGRVLDEIDSNFSTAAKWQGLYPDAEFAV